ncbi:MAG: methyltransferase domain-containing protein [bacterium]
MEFSINKDLKKYFSLYNYYRFIAKKIGYNLIIDKMVKPISFHELSKIKGVNLEYFDINKSEYKLWVKKYYPDWESQFGCIFHKKLIEFYITFSFLTPKPDDIFMDAAGAVNSYISNLKCKKKYLQDNRIPQSIRAKLGNDIHYIESDGGSIPLSNRSVDKISCHHSFEHFQEFSDILFINEIQRLLRPKGKCCIIQVFIGDRFIELTDAITLKKKFDGRSKRVIDPSSILPGGRNCGNFARIYDVKTFQERVIEKIDLLKFNVTISELRLDRQNIPDLTLDCHKHVTSINRPYRAMTIERISD